MADRARAGALLALAVGLVTSITLTELALAALLAVALLSGRLRRPPLLAPIGAFVAWSAVSALVSARPVDSLLEAVEALWLAAFWVLVAALPDARAAHRFAAGLFVLAGLVSTLAVVQVAACPAAAPDLPVLARLFRKCGRAHGFFSIYMTLAGVLTIVLIGAMPRLAAARRHLAWAGPLWAVGLVALGLTYVRGAWVGFLFAAAASMTAMRRRAVLVAALVAVLTVVVAVPGVGRRIGTINLANESTRDRLAMLAGGLHMVRDHPLLGVGPGQVKHVYPVYATPEALRRSTSHLHDTPLQIAVERGLVGLGLWLWIFGAWFVYASRAWLAIPTASTEDRALALGALLAIAAFLVSGLFEYNFGDTEVLLTACAAMALPFVLARSHGVDPCAARRLG